MPDTVTELSPFKTDLASLFRAAPPSTTLLPQLGALADLPGLWVGRGFSLTSLPDKHQNKPFRLLVNATQETLNFTPIGGPIPNRGSAQDDISFLGLHYFQQVSDAVTNGGLHFEPGLWLNLPSSTVPAQKPAVARLGSIPHGDSLLAQGPSFIVNGGPQIGVVDSTPFTLDPQTGARVNDTNAAYLSPFQNTALPPDVPAGALHDPNLVLSQAIKGQDITRTVVLTVNANPIGGINGTPLKPAEQVGGILNIPFVTTNANANSFSAIFWIETVRLPDGTEFMQLQYTQTIILDFIGLKWPHIAVATLVKQ